MPRRARTGDDSSLGAPTDPRRARSPRRRRRRRRRRRAVDRSERDQGARERRASSSAIRSSALRPRRTPPTRRASSCTPGAGRSIPAPGREEVRRSSSCCLGHADRVAPAYSSRTRRSTPSDGQRSCERRRLVRPGHRRGPCHRGGASRAYALVLMDCQLPRRRRLRGDAAHPRSRGRASASRGRLATPAPDSRGDRLLDARGPRARAARGNG